MGVMTMEFESWYREVHESLVRALSRSLADETVAREAVDEALARALERWDRVATLRSPAGWTHVVALNAARRTMRRRGVEAGHLDAGRVHWAATGAASVTAGRTTTDPVAEAVVDTGPVRAAVASLSPRQATVISLRHGLDLTETEIAERLGISRSTVSSTLRDAHRALARALRPSTAAEEDVMDLQLARMVSGDDTGCEVAYLDGEVTERARFGAAVDGRIRVRRGDLVAVDVGATPPEVVWRWWQGVVEEVGAGEAVVRRPAEGGEARVSVVVPGELAELVRVDDPVWFGRDGDELVAVAVRGRSSVARAKLPAVAEAYG